MSKITQCDAKVRKYFDMTTFLSKKSWHLVWVPAFGDMWVMDYQPTEALSFSAFSASWRASMRSSMSPSMNAGRLCME